MDKRLLEILACPLCKGKLIYKQDAEELLCRFDKLAYPIQGGIPIMLVDKARSLIEER
ncbi:Trm112 family protein [Coxiella-like endosymbiont]|uniref:Trm112 family protein n=1 Tax=Coxiella-like endosymbiont TaxID=1592897 RepID=UPI0027295C22|nr:Trm112 family protein [Coxiella-like endosymbiont]